MRCSFSPPWRVDRAFALYGSTVALTLETFERTFIRATKFLNFERVSIVSQRIILLSVSSSGSSRGRSSSSSLMKVETLEAGRSALYATLDACTSSFLNYDVLVLVPMKSAQRFVAAAAAAAAYGLTLLLLYGRTTIILANSLSRL